jgi:hypothetical protein
MFGRSYAPGQAAKTTLFAAVSEATVPRKAPQAAFLQSANSDAFA